MNRLVSRRCQKWVCACVCVWQTEREREGGEVGIGSQSLSSGL